ncbi:phage tail protein [Microbacterium sp. B35-04]|uniref:SIP domain-containing protein n=1 Tax=unclassified Microbacterium TaxID=2609290 RepID=UPI0013D278B6|nr:MULTISPECIES: SIP domain-containing protein [unclassified Microbacterium]KAF2415327.1 phage tail protein [Microbacterium sp. B35-04]KAF2420244.1 phage tail protein [Microbacterium sp. B35-30]
MPHTTQTQAVAHNASACRASRHTRVQHLITADESSLAELEAVLATLPICSTGRVFIEIPDDSWQADITAPSRMVVTWLDRSQRSGAPGTGRGCGSGEALARAVTAWADEMLCAEDDQTRIHLLGGYLGTADIVDHLVDLGIRADSIHAPEQYGLTTAR